MDKPVENISYHRPEWDEQGRPYYTAITYPQSENHKAVLLKLADRIIPVIFIPGVMGSNLKNENGEVWQSSATSFSKWLFANPQKKKICWILKQPKLTCRARSVTNRETATGFPHAAPVDGDLLCL